MSFLIVNMYFLLFHWSVSSSALLHGIVRVKHLYLLSCLQTDELLEPSKLVEMSVGGGAARLTLPYLAKDDEGLYTLRIFTKDGTAEHSAYLFVSGTSLTANNSQQHLICFDDSCLCYIVL